MWQPKYVCICVNVYLCKCLHAERKKKREMYIYWYTWLPLFQSININMIAINSLNDYDHHWHRLTVMRPTMALQAIRKIYCAGGKCRPLIVGKFVPPGFTGYGFSSVWLVQIEWNATYHWQAWSLLLSFTVWRFIWLTRSDCDCITHMQTVRHFHQ